ncbi:CIA30 family protein [Winogradskyella sp. DF17]|uniref:CIA30 family protein n=1 Tax=Winogradskyella pelagia TaxID=2819984 RepID=A0ABS3T1Q2_9FLAO|nr:CIA30 family protein [Winogradskyella sp. DF17]MBO3116662.1 CIA30 family protein [Winogradskyella sp. DF17]
MQDATLFKFNKNSNLQNWRILDDVVMGGRSNGEFTVSKEGFGKFYGDISLDNNGGFSSVRYYFETKKTKPFSKFILKIKGDGKRYQFRVKDKSNQRHSYIYEFQTSGDWETVEIPFDKMYASFRGYRLNISNFDGAQMEEIAFLIGNKKEESFELLIDTILLD